MDGNLVTSRQPSGIPAFNREMVTLFAIPEKAYLRDPAVMLYAPLPPSDS